MTEVWNRSKEPTARTELSQPIPNRKDPTTGTTEAEMSHAPSGLLSSSGVRATLQDYCKGFVVFGSCWQTGKHHSLTRSLPALLAHLFNYAVHA